MKSLPSQNQKYRIESQPANEANGPFSALRDNDTPQKIKVTDQLSNGETGYFTSDLAEYQANLEALGPAIDDEESASYITPLVRLPMKRWRFAPGVRKK